MATRGEKGRKTTYGRLLTGARVGGSATRKTTLAGHTGSRVGSGDLKLTR